MPKPQHDPSCGARAQDAALLDALRAGLAEAGVAAKVVYSGGVDVDVLAQVGGGLQMDTGCATLTGWIIHKALDGPVLSLSMA